MRVAVIDYAGGNLASAARALAHAAARAGIAAEILVTAEPGTVAASDRIVLPGQGAFADCKRGINAVPGLAETIRARTDDGVPFLGICVGMQLMAARGLEHGATPGFGWIAGDIARMDPDPASGDAETFRLPQIGWNALDFTRDAHPLLDGIAPGDHVYFVHSYALTGHDPADVVACTDYAGRRPAMVARGNRAGTQFHVEKSQEVGLRILANFLAWTPAAEADLATRQVVSAAR